MEYNRGLVIWHASVFGPGRPDTGMSRVNQIDPQRWRHQEKFPLVIVESSKVSQREKLEEESESEEEEQEEKEEVVKEVKEVSFGFLSPVRNEYAMATLTISFLLKEDGMGVLFRDILFHIGKISNISARIVQECDHLQQALEKIRDPEYEDMIEDNKKETLIFLS
ncbi:hypothetical protein M0802_005188 [Mischocyttarus mexicanus]|nr:hypothetical protein M0802_005188 [Mischocyttarus mexicanus]